MKRIFILLTAVILCLQFLLSCESNSEPSPIRNPLTIETDCTYSESEKKELSDKTVSVIEKAIIKNIGESLSEEKRAYLKETIEKDLWNTLIEVPIYPNEFKAILEAADMALDANSINELCALYSKGASVLGAKRNGYLFFELSELLLSAYREDLLPILENDIGKESFSDICGVFGFIASIGTGLISEGSSFINDSELLMILQRQADHYLNLKAEPSQWKAAAKLFCEILPINGDDMYSAVISELADNSFFESLSESIPEFLELYAELVSSMTKDDLRLIRSNGSYTMKTVCAVISRSEEKFKRLVSTIEQSSAMDQSIGANALKELGYEQKYLDYVDNMQHAKPRDLFDAIKAYGENSSISTYGEFNTAMILYIYRLSPALAFITEHKLAELN